MGWETPLLVAALQAAVDDALYVGGLDGDDADCTSIEAVTWPAVDHGAVDASNQPVLDVAGACTIASIALFPTSSGGGYESALAFCSLDPAVEFTEAGTYTLTQMTMSIIS